MNISWMKIIQWETLQRILCCIPSIFRSGGLSFLSWEKKRVDFPLDVDIPPSSSAICELINPIKVNQVKDSNWGLPCNVTINVFVFKGSCTAFLLPPRIPLISRIILPSVILPIWSFSVCLSLFFLPVSLSLSQQPSPCLSFCLSPSMLHYLQCGNA